MNHKVVIHTAESRENMNGCSGQNEFANNRKSAYSLRFINCVLVFCVTSGIMTTCVVIHLGIENYNRLHEYRELKNEILLLKWRMNASGIPSTVVPVNSLKKVDSPTVAARTKLKTIKSEATPTKSILNEEVLNIKSENIKIVPENITNIENMAAKVTSSPTSNILRDQPPGLFDSDLSIQNINSQVRHCMARVKRLEDIQTEYENSQDFLRQQMHRRFASIENLLDIQNGLQSADALPVFAASLSSDVKISSYSDVSKTLVFDDVTLNEGYGYDQTSGKFISPIDGIYVFHVSIIARFEGENDGKYFANSGKNTCSAELRQNEETTSKVTSVAANYAQDDYNGFDDKNFVEYNETPIAITLVTRLKKYSEIYVTVSSGCVFLGSKSFTLSNFQGYYLHG